MFVYRHQTDDGRVIDVMLFKGSQELVTVLAHHFQRHHLITKYVAPESNAIVRKSLTGKPQSKFLSSFLDGNATEKLGERGLTSFDPVWGVKAGYARAALPRTLAPQLFSLYTHTQSTVHSVREAPGSPTVHRRFCTS